jgi:hypothetical protein
MKQTAFFILFCALLSAQNMPQPHIEKINVPANVFEKASTKAELIEELRASIYEDHEGILNLQREAKIQELAKKLRFMR